ncbi:uncharacterized protein GGS22DRAFT_189100 [Annulohypoxylon maeteangense]|uniref:uncharacterized protein n=1 Tax=Annulohypoxylon maeteangense TaxID=1927788 RepID=UPI002008B434|nr:uncharacterized protein GGS22DRAFT_189100 [Annulohypoxylon maeteangense]KAI0884887.1 hypothetical protein GGS22DRAFT_189100 [Annulohypoxylon maeteangense]
MSEYSEFFDFDAFPESDEYAIDFSELGNSNPIGVSEFTDLQPQHSPCVTGPVPQNVENRAETALFQRDNQAAALDTDIQTTSENQQHSPDTADHQQIQGYTPFSCNECLASFRNTYQFQLHAKLSRHKTVACSCGKSFSRLDTLVRHQRSFREDIRLYPCPTCKHLQGKHGFRRRDHLIQHLTGYHKFNFSKIEKIAPTKRQGYGGPYHCLFTSCEFHRGEGFTRLSWDEKYNQAPFPRQSEYIKHMREVHELTPFPCLETECKRTGANGYLLWNGFKNHMVREHKITPEPVEKFDLGYKCDHCGESLERIVDYMIHNQVLHQPLHQS